MTLLNSIRHSSLRSSSFHPFSLHLHLSSLLPGLIDPSYRPHRPPRPLIATSPPAPHGLRLRRFPAQGPRTDDSDGLLNRPNRPRVSNSSTARLVNPITALTLIFFSFLIFQDWGFFFFFSFPPSPHRKKGRRKREEKEDRGSILRSRFGSR